MEAVWHPDKLESNVKISTPEMAWKRKSLKYERVQWGALVIELPAKLPSKCQRKLSKGGCYMFLTSVFSFILSPVASPDEAKIMPAVKRKMFQYHKHRNEGWIWTKGDNRSIMIETNESLIAWNASKQDDLVKRQIFRQLQLGAVFKKHI